jgi:hypothetical protein
MECPAGPDIVSGRYKPVLVVGKTDTNSKPGVASMLPGCNYPSMGSRRFDSAFRPAGCLPSSGSGASGISATGLIRRIIEQFRESKGA